jgi:hypothetical protein
MKTHQPLGFAEATFEIADPSGEASVVLRTPDG